MNEKNDVKRDDADDRGKTIRHETIPGERPVHPAPGNRGTASNKEGDGPGTARSTADEDLT
jgi:hypothetical protein